ncbi:MAG: hypothetical protein IJJ28_08215 [Lentisphaeria bacterium]|nr:hypothetical protein [Lentisphaeria bacterium]
MSQHQIPIFSAALAAAMFFSGCANHLEDITKEIPENSRSVLGRQYVITMDKEIPDSSSFKIKVDEMENVQVTVYQVRRNSSLYTPYEGWRESYEFLAGLGLFPVAVVSNIFSVFTFGMFPFAWSGTVTKYSFDGMNPCMNFESRDRVEEIPAKVERALVDSYTESKQKPLAEENLIVRAGGDAYWRVRTDKLGRAEIVLLSTDLEKSKPVTSRHLDIYLEKDNAKCKTVPMSRRLLGRLADARRAMIKYYSAPNGEGLATCVKKLEELSFEDLAFRLEEDELGKHPDFRAAFDRAVK